MRLPQPRSRPTRWGHTRDDLVDVGPQNEIWLSILATLVDGDKYLLSRGPAENSESRPVQYISWIRVFARQSLQITTSI